MFTVYDEAADAYLPPFFASTLGLAVRSFTEAANDPSTSFNKYPGSFTLFEIGVFDDSTGNVTPLKAHKTVGKASDFLAKPETVKKGK